MLANRSLPPKPRGSLERGLEMQRISKLDQHFTDKGLVEALVAIEDPDDDVDVILKAEEEVKVTEANVGVNGDHKEAQAGKGEAVVGGLAHAAFIEGNDGDRGMKSKSSGLWFHWRRVVGV